MYFDSVSIIVPFYNDYKNISKCLDSIWHAMLLLPLADRRRLEIIIVDDASPQPFLYEGPLVDLIYHRLEQNSGVGAARNAGARLAKYNYLMFIDSDVFLEENHLAIVFDILREKEVKILQGTVSSAPANKNPSLFHHYMAISWYYLFQSKYCRCFMATLCMVINRPFFFQMGGFPECYPDSGGEEFEFSARIREEDRDAIVYDLRLIFYHNYSGFTARLKKVLARSYRLKPSVMPLNFQIEAGMRGTGAALMSLSLLLLLVNPLTACLAYLFLGVLCFVADWELSKCFLQKHSWKLALASVFYRQVEYSAALCGVIGGLLKRRLCF